MTSVATTYLPLTTTFTAPADCWITPWFVQGGPTEWFKQGGDLVASCFPPAFPFSTSRIVYSPGICPAGWTSACQTSVTTSGSTQDVVTCCPQSMGCVSSNSLHDWEASFGCVSPYSVDMEKWSTNSSKPYVSSMYQMQVMIVAAETTTMSSTSQGPSSTSPSPASNTASSATATATANAAPVSSGGLSKGAIAGIAIGTIVGVAVIALLAYIAWVVKRNRTQDVRPESMAQPSGYASAVAYPDYSLNPAYAPPHQYPVEPTEMDGRAKSPQPRYEL